MRIQFVNTGPISGESGGYLYNRAIIEYGRARGISIDYHNEIYGAGYDWHILDSLYLHKGGVVSARDLDKTVVLMHQVPVGISITGPAHLADGGEKRLRYIVTGKAAKDVLLREWAVPPDRVAYVPPGMPETWRRKKHDSGEMSQLLMVANYVPGKGYEHLPDLLEALKGHDWVLTCYGNPDLVPHFHQKVQSSLAQHDEGGRVALHSWCDRATLNQEMMKSDMLLSLSESETYGMAIYEALCTGLPVLMFRTGNWEEFAATKRTAIVDNGDIKAFAARLEAMLSGREAFAAQGGRRLGRSWEMAGKVFFNHCENWLHAWA